MVLFIKSPDATIDVHVLLWIFTDCYGLLLWFRIGFNRYLDGFGSISNISDDAGDGHDDADDGHDDPDDGHDDPDDGHDDADDGHDDDDIFSQF